MEFLQTLVTRLVLESDTVHSLQILKQLRLCGIKNNLLFCSFMGILDCLNFQSPGQNICNFLALNVMLFSQHVNVGFFLHIM